jgi:hypothetical protein
VECIGFRHAAREQELPLVIRAHKDSAEVSSFPNSVWERTCL